MGRSEEKSKKRRSHSISDEDEGRSKRHRTRDDRESKGKRKKKKIKNKDKEKSKKSHKHSRNREDKGTKSAEKRDRKHSKGSTSVDFEVEELSNDDYYSKNNEFSTWLKEEKGLFFSNLSSEEAHKLFINFVKAWNSKRLQSRYYEGITSGPRTGHDWKITHKKDL